MPSTPDSFVAHPRYTAEFARARALLFAHPGRWRVIYHYDGDGIASASAAARALARLGYPVQTTPLLGVERDRIEPLVRATHGPLLVVDTGASWLDLFATHGHPVIVLDHHQYPQSEAAASTLPAHVALVNPLDWGVDGMSELSAATLTWLFTIFLDPVNWDNAPWGLSGAIADRQHVGGFRGLNRRLVEEASARSFVQVRRGLAFFGPTLGEALTASIDPYLAGVSGRPAAVAELLHGLGLDPDRPPELLDAAERDRLAQAIRSRLARQAVAPEVLEAVAHDRYYLPALGKDAEELANLQNAAGRAGEPSIGIAVALGDPGALARAAQHEASWRAGILEGLRRIETEGVKSLEALQWFVSGETTLAGTQAGLAMTYLLDPNRPVFVFSNGDGRVKVSARATHRLVAQGLDLAAAVREAASSVGGEGGGHRIASGATIPAGREEEFRRLANARIAEQLGVARGPTG